MYEELHNLYASPNVSYGDQNKDEVGGSCSTHGDEECIEFCAENQKGIRRLWGRCNDCIGMYPREIDREVVDGFQPAEDGYLWPGHVNTVMNLWVP
jgi:hypothetical protein